MHTLTKSSGRKAKAKLQLQQVFGVALHELAERDGKAIPSIVTHAIAHIEAKGLQIQGIFRVSGIQREVDELRERYDNGEEVNLKDKDVHNVTSLLKLYFRELPEPLLTFQLYQHCLAISKHYTNEKRKPLYYRVLVHSLPIYNRLVLLKLLAFLFTCSLQEELNSMSADNLALVFSINILRPLICNEKVLFAESTKINKAVSEFIVFSEELSVRNGDEQNLFDRVGLLNSNVEVKKEGGEKVKLEKGDIVFIYGSTDEPIMKVEHDGDVLMVPNDKIDQHVSTNPAHKPLAKPAPGPTTSNKSKLGQRNKPNFSSRVPRRAQLPGKKGKGSSGGVAISSPTPISVDQARHASSRLPHSSLPANSSSPASLTPPSNNKLPSTPSAPIPFGPTGSLPPPKQQQQPQQPTKGGPPPRPSVGPPKIAEEGGGEGEGEWVEEWVVEESWVVDDGGFCLCEYVYELEAQMSGCLEEIDRANRQYLLTLEDVRQARFEMNQLLAQLTQLTKNYALTPIDPTIAPPILPTGPATPVTPVVASPSSSPSPSPSPRTPVRVGRHSSASSLSSLGSPRGKTPSPSPLSCSSASPTPPEEDETIGSFSSSPTPSIPPKPKKTNSFMSSSTFSSPTSSPPRTRTPQRPSQPPPQKPSSSSLSAPLVPSRPASTSLPPPSPRKPPPPRPSVSPPSKG